MGDLRGNKDKNSCPSPSSAFQISSFLTLKLGKVLRVLERFSLDCRKGLVLVLVLVYYALWLASVFTLVLVL